MKSKIIDKKLLIKMTKIALR